MGDARKNQNSPQYRGPLPDFVVQPGLTHRLYPSDEWLEANKEALAGPTPPDPRPEDCILEVAVAATMSYPSRVIDERYWKRGTAAINILGRVPFATFKAEIDGQVADSDPLGNETAPTAEVERPS